VARQAGGDAVAVILQSIAALRFEEDLVPLLVGEADYLVLDGRAIARSAALNLSAVHGGAVQIGSNEVVDGVIRIGDVALQLRLGDGIVEEAERRGVGVAGLRLGLAEVDGPAIEAAGRAGLETGELEAALRQAIAERLRRLIAGPPAARFRLPGVHQSLEEG